jgi:putative membrane protein
MTPRHTLADLNPRQLTVLIVVPVLVALLLAIAYRDPITHLDRVAAAVVNQDQPVTINGQSTPLGRELAATLINGDDPTYSWTLTSAKDAADGMASGRFHTVVTIPPEFSNAATSAGGTKPDGARQAAITIEAAADVPFADPLVGHTLADAARRTLGKTVTETYLDNVYLGFNTLHDRLTEAADGATRLSQGADTLTEGLYELSTGADQLSGGLATIDNRTAQLAAGARALAAGISQLRTAQSPEQLDALFDQIHQLQTSIGNLDQLTTGLHQTVTDAQRISTGLNSARDGAQQLADGSHQLAAGLADATHQIPTYTDADRDNVKKVVAEPIAAIDLTRDAAKWSAMAMLAVLTLWASALVTYSILTPTPRELRTSDRSTPWLTIKGSLPGVLPAVAQAGTVTAVLTLAYGIPVAHVALLLGVTLLSAALFMLVNRALAAAFDNWGRTASLAILVLVIATGVTSAQPGPLQAVADALPTASALSTIRQAAAGHTAGALHALLPLGVWLAVTIAALLLITDRRRLIPLSEFDIPAHVASSQTQRTLHQPKPVGSYGGGGGI